MTTTSEEAATPAAAQVATIAAEAESRSRSDSDLRHSGLRLLWRGFLWCLVAMLAAGIAGFIAGITLGTTGAKFGMSAMQLKTIYFICGMVAGGAVLLYAAHRNAYASAHGDLAAGLGKGPVRRLWLVILLSVAVALYGSFVSLTITLQPTGLAKVTAVGWLLNATLFALGVLLAPLAEERFFRGWLWTALKQHWGTLPIAIATSVMWLAMHLPDVTRMIILVPVAVCTVLARRYSETVTAALAVHAVYNIFSIGTPLLLLLG